jgi:hypothetical protein
MKCARALGVLAATIVMLGAWTSYGRDNADAASRQAMPFGLKQGMSVEELGDKAAHLGRGMYRVASVPLPNPDLEFYVAQVSPRTGLCYIKGVGKPVRTSAAGTELQSRFETTRDEVSATYGNYRNVDMLLSNSMWVGPHDWMVSLAEKERLLFAHWAKETRANLGPHLTNVFVGATAKNADSGYVVVEYYFDNEPECVDEIESTTAALF